MPGVLRRGQGAVRRVLPQAPGCEWPYGYPGHARSLALRPTAPWSVRAGIPWTGRVRGVLAPPHRLGSLQSQGLAHGSSCPATVAV